MRSKSKIKSSHHRFEPILLKVVPPLAGLLIRILMASCRVIRVEGKVREKEALSRSRGRAVYATWHQRISYHFHWFAHRGLIVMISQSRDGEYGVRIINRFGYKNVRGSSTRGGFNALREITRKIRKGACGAVLADGPQGPPRVAKLGPVVMARTARVPLLPIAWGTDRCWVLNSWDRFMIPKPFARIAICYGEPIWVSSSGGRETLEAYRKLLEDRLNQAARWCDEQFGAERPWRKATTTSTETG